MDEQKEVDSISELDIDLLMEQQDEYQVFVDKFKPKLTTDDCFTPGDIYQAVLSWVVKRYDLPKGTSIIRPFWPGADYQLQDYPEGCVVVDNPPFSILAEIERYYMSKRIAFFLFAPALTCFKNLKGLHYVFVDESIVYANGAKVATSFVTNMGECLMESAPDLHKTLHKINKTNQKNETAA